MAMSRRVRCPLPWPPRALLSGPDGTVQAVAEDLGGSGSDRARRAAITRDHEGMVHGPEDAVAFRLWPPVAIGAPLLVGWLATVLWGDPVDLGGWRVPLGWALVLLLQPSTATDRQRLDCV